MTFSEIFKNNFLEQMSEFSMIDSLIALGAAFLLGLLIYTLYKRTFKGVMYSESFNLSLILLTLLTTFIILAVTSNVVLSLGMVGALSIVRFRTAIKDPLDLVYLFWAIGGGIVVGAKMIPLALVGSLFIALILWLKSSISDKNQPYLVIIHINEEKAEIKAQSILFNRAFKVRLKSKTKNKLETELIFEIQLNNQDNAFINEIAAIEGITNVQCVSYNGDFNE
jgi:uncharacterized membrane protein YhiD involved in acid resistance